MCEQLHPGYKPPTRKALANKHLDNTHAKLQASMKVNLQNKTVTMQQDGWSTPANEPVISTSFTFEGVGYFMAVKLTGSKANAADCAEA